MDGKYFSTTKKGELTRCGPCIMLAQSLLGSAPTDVGQMLCRRDP